ncbi:HET-domain-containing protein [Stipitochalara longipes BDJ]|nr:HET-domain-containing protein [Stipitochalara longipes BDJ]
MEVYEGGINGRYANATTRASQLFSFGISRVGDPAAESTRIRSFLHDFGGESVAWARRRLWECELLHQDCMAPAPLLSPTRLLRIDLASDGSGICVRLQLTAPSEVIEVTTEKYATLSYCWGGPQEFKLTTSSEATLMRGISVSLLPNTLRDAVYVTWDLGFKWIWIDSLCIRQDDPEEKATEIARMHSIYTKSCVTISATRASHCHQGFLHQASLPHPETIGYKLPFASPCGRLGSVILSRNKMSSPVDDRGWTLQEHLLGSRILRFTDVGLHWSCGGTSLFEEENPGILPSSDVKYLSRAYEMYRGFRSDNRECKHWMNVVEEYASRELTNDSDRLPAFAGIAESWARTSKDHYLAGLWKSHLPLGLLWSSAQPFLQDESRAYCAPSWSWASLVGQVDWFDHIFTKVDPMLEVGSCIVKPTHPQAPYGAVQSGFLMVQGLLQQTVMDEASTVPARADQENEYLDLDGADVHLDFWDEVLASKVEGAKLFCLQICCFDESTTTGPSGLILTTRDEKLFSRVGFFAFVRPDKYDVQELEDFDALLKLSEERKLVQRSAFQDIVPRSITII